MTDPNVTLASDIMDAIGRTEEAQDHITPSRMMPIAAMLGLEGLGLEGLGLGGQAAITQEGAVLPPLFHLFFANNHSPAQTLDHDGHEKLGTFIPDVTRLGPYHRRMWAAGDIRFEGAFHVGDVITRRSTITAIEQKQGKTGGLVFVTVERALTAPKGKIDETRTIVYREGVYRKQSKTPSPDSIDIPASPAIAHQARWRPDLTQLFRYSALTWNSHRIHYDLAHCREDEGYPDIVTHGPFTAMMLANMTEDGVRFDGNPLARFQFRGVQALYAYREGHEGAGREVGLNILQKNLDDGGSEKGSDDAADKVTSLEAVNHHGQLAMTAKKWMA